MPGRLTHVARLPAWTPSVIALMLGLSACGAESSDPRAMVAATRTQLRARIAEFSRRARPTDRTPVALGADAERVCGVSALGGPPSRRVARRAGGRGLDV